MRKEHLFIILASLVALVIGLQIGFASLPAPKPKQVEESVTRPDDFQAGLRDAKTELKMVQRFARTSTLEHTRSSTLVRAKPGFIPVRHRRVSPSIGITLRVILKKMFR